MSVYYQILINGVNLVTASLAQPEPLPNTTLRKGYGDIAYNDLWRFTNILERWYSLIVVGMSRCYAKALHL